MNPCLLLADRVSFFYPLCIIFTSPEQMKFFLRATALLVLLQSCSQNVELTDPGKAVLAKVRDLVLRCDTTCENKTDRINGGVCSIDIKWIAGEQQNNREYHLYEVSCCSEKKKGHTFRFEVRGDSVLGPDVVKNSEWVRVLPNWPGPEKYGFIKSMAADQREMQYGGERFEILTGHVQLLSVKNDTITCDTLVWRNHNRLLLVPGRVQIRSVQGRMNGKGLSMKVDGSEWTVKNIITVSYYFPTDSH